MTRGYLNVVYTFATYRLIYGSYCQRGRSSAGRLGRITNNQSSIEIKMRQLKGKVKETRKEKRERKMDNLKNKQALMTVVLPVLGVIALLIGLFVYVNSRPMPDEQ